MITNSIKQYLFDKNYATEFNEFYEADNSSEINLISFQNYYLRKNALIKGNKITSRTTNGKTTTLTKDDFFHGFTSSIWSNLNFAQQHTLLHWLQSTLSDNTPLPTLDFISSFSIPEMNGAYQHKSNSIYLNPLCLHSGYEIASILIHEMDHHDKFTNPLINSSVRVGSKQIDLKSSFSKKEIIDINLDEVNATDLESVIFYKNLTAPIAIKPSTAQTTDGVDFLKDYIQKELYFYSPLEQSAITKEKDHLQFMTDGQSLDKKDELQLQRIYHSIDEVMSFEKMPILKRLNPVGRVKLLNSTIQSRYYLSNRELHSSPNFTKYLMQKSSMLTNLYQQLQQGENDLSL